MRAPSMLPCYHDLASGAAAAHEAHQAYEAAEAAALECDVATVGLRLDDAVDAARRMLRPLGYDLTPNTARVVTPRTEASR